MPATHVNELANELDAMRPTLLKLAGLQLRNQTWAEDVVSEETILAVLEKPDAFQGRSALKTWVIGILKFKIIDCLRVRQRETALPVSSEDLFDIEDAVFSADGHFATHPVEWTAPVLSPSQPDQLLNQRQFFDVLELCMEALPPAQGRIFMMREWFEFSTEEICQHLSVQPTNAAVMLHRARLRLRECMQVRWFQEPAK